MNKKNKQEIQEKYVELQYMEQQMKNIRQQVQAIESQVTELQNTVEYIDELRKVKKGTEIIVQINSGIFAKANLADNDSYLVNAGANAIVEKNAEDTKKVMEMQAAELHNIAQKMRNDFNEIAENAMKMQDELQKLIEENKE